MDNTSLVVARDKLWAEVAEFQPPSLQRWSRFLRQPAKVDSTTQRMIHHEDPQTVYG